MCKKVFIIFNPVAGSGRSNDVLRKVLLGLEARNLRSFEVLETKLPGDATHLTTEAVNQGANLLIVVGGDGTINEVVNGLVTTSSHESSDCELGIINSGSGADFARSLNLPREIDQQLDLILTHSYRLVDIGYLLCEHDNGKAIGRYFINECQIGIGGKVVANMGKSAKRFGGTLDFGLAAISQLVQYKATEMCIGIDQQDVKSQNMLGVVVANGIYSAGGMKMAPHASVEDGYLNILGMSEMNLLNRLLTFGKVYTGSHITSKFASYQKGRKIEIGAEYPIWIEADGELVGKTPCEILLIPGVIRVRY